MDSQGNDVDDILAGLYRAASGNQRWDDVLSAATASLGLMGSQMVGVSATTGAVVFSHAAAANFPPEAELDYVRTYHRVDPRIPLLQAGLPGDWLYDESAFGEEVATTNAYYRDFLIPYGARYTASAKILERNGEAVLIAFVSSLNDRGFDAPRRQRLMVLGYHLCEAAAIYQKTRRHLANSFAGSALLNRLARPAFLLSADGTVSFVSEAAERYLRDAKGMLQISNGALLATSREAGLELARAFASLVMAADAGETSERKVVRLRSANGVDRAVAALTLLVPQQTMHVFGNLPQVLMVVHDNAHRAERSPDVSLWEAVHSLTPGQSRVALAVYEGRSIKEAARCLHISEETVKTHLKEVFAKTNTTRQSQLVLALAALESW